jgi:hypothetical protein
MRRRQCCSNGRSCAANPDHRVDIEPSAGHDRHRAKRHDDCANFANADHPAADDRHDCAKRPVADFAAAGADPNSNANTDPNADTGPEPADH